MGTSTGILPDPASSAALHRAEELSASLPPLMVAADRIATTVFQGTHGRRRVGHGEAFWQFRRYQFGDPVNDIDWRQSGKSQRIYIRQNEWEAAQSVWLTYDGSASMAYSSSRDLPTKSERAAILSLALSSLLIRGNERVALTGSGLTPSNSRAALQNMAMALTAETKSAQASVFAKESLPRNARLVIVSDFLDDPEALAQEVRRYVEQGVRGVLLRIIDPAEESLPFDGRVVFEGLEKEGDILIERVGDVRAEYGKYWRQHGEHLAEISRQANWRYLTHHTQDSPECILMQLYLLLSDARLK